MFPKHQITKFKCCLDAHWCLFCSTHRSIGRSDSSSFLKDGRQLRHLLQCGLWTGVFVSCHGHFPFLGFHIDGCDLSVVIASLMSCSRERDVCECVWTDAGPLWGRYAHLLSTSAASDRRTGHSRRVWSGISLPGFLLWCPWGAWCSDRSVLPTACLPADSHTHNTCYSVSEELHSQRSPL